MDIKRNLGWSFACGALSESEISPAVHPAMVRVPVAFEPGGLGGATGRDAEPVV